MASRDPAGEKKSSSPFSPLLDSPSHTCFLLLAALLAFLLSLRALFSLSASLVLFLAVLQSFFVLEPAYALLGLSRQKFLPSFLQILSRVLASWCVFFFFPRLREHSWAVPAMYLSWYTSDLVRFAYYVFARRGGRAAERVLGGLRYSLFMVLYPVGVWCELFLCAKGMRIRSLKGGGAFAGGAVAYLAGFLFLYGRLLRRRSRRKKRRAGAPSGDFN